ncbi:hypothetical protein HS9_03739 [Bacillus velezensis]|nr:hypothetical protein HS9_03739 [Bacillus velezensis]
MAGYDNHLHAPFSFFIRYAGSLGNENQVIKNEEMLTKCED